MNIVRVPRLVKPGDLNHHGSLYAGRAAEWFVEACYLCAAQARIAGNDGLPGDPRPRSFQAGPGRREDSNRKPGRSRPAGPA